LILLEYSLTTHWSRVGYLKTSVKPLLLNVSSGAGVAWTIQSCAASWKTVHCANPFRRRAADSLAPKHPLRRPAGRLAPWFYDDCCHARRHCRRLERQYRRTSSADDRRLSLTLCGADFGCIGQRRKHTGWIVCRKTGAHRHWCGSHLRRCWVMIAIHLVLQVIGYC